MYCVALYVVTRVLSDLNGVKYLMRLYRVRNNDNLNNICPRGFFKSRNGKIRNIKTRLPEIQFFRVRDNEQRHLH